MSPEGFDIGQEDLDRESLPEFNAELVLASFVKNTMEAIAKQGRNVGAGQVTRFIPNSSRTELKAKLATQLAKNATKKAMMDVICETIKGWMNPSSSSSRSRPARQRRAKHEHRAKPASQRPPKLNAVDHMKFFKTTVRNITLRQVKKLDPKDRGLLSKQYTTRNNALIDRVNREFFVG